MRQRKASLRETSRLLRQPRGFRRLVTTAVVAAALFGSGVTGSPNAAAESANGVADTNRAWSSSLDAGSVGTCVVMTDKSVKCFGTFDTVVGTAVDPVPTISLGEGSHASTITGGGQYNCAVLTTGKVRCWGLGTMFGGLSFNVDIPLNGLAQSVSGGDNYACALKTDGVVQCFGYNRPIDDSSFGVGATATAVAVGGYAGCAIVQTSANLGGVRCFGSNAFGSHGGSSQTVDVPGVTATALALGDVHTCAIVSSGGVKCWGRNRFGELGVSQDLVNYATDVPQDVLLGENAVAIGSGAWASCAVLVSGRVKCWGTDVDPNNGSWYGFLGQSSATPGPQPPQEVPLPAGAIATSVTVGNYHACATLNTGVLWCWGWAGYLVMGSGVVIPGTNVFPPTQANLGGQTVGPVAPTPPDTSITSGPSALTNSTTATFVFAGGTTQECSLDGSSFVPCSSPKTYPGLGDGDRTFSVRAVNGLLVDPSPAVSSWTIDTVAPTINILVPSVAATFTVGQIVTPGFNCSDPHPGTCDVTTPVDTSTVGEKQFVVTATDAAGNMTTAQRTYNVVAPTTAPQFTSLTPPSGTVGSAYTHTFTASGTAPITFSSTALPAGLTLVGGVLSGTPTQAGTFTVTASNGTLPNATATIVIAPAMAGGDLKILLNASVGLFRQGGDAKYLIDVKNESATAVAGPITVTQVLPVGVTYLSAKATGWTCRVAGQTLTCARSGSMSPGTSSDIQVQVRVMAARDTSLTSTVTLTPSDAQPSNNVSSVTVVVRR
jgi:Domain of unknown function DUF11/Regulator of chromosome condensation (RCC1) repeat